MYYAKAADNPLVQRDEVEQLVRDLVAPLLPHLTHGRAGIVLGSPTAEHGEPATSIEGLIRPLWGLAPLAAGGATFTDWPLWRAGLVAGTDPAHAEFWGWPRDGDQRIVEAAALGHALAIARAQLWDPLTSGQQAQLATWLARASTVATHDSNWHWFPVMANLGLRACGQHAMATDDGVHLARIEAFHTGGGWYSDGDTAAADAHVRTGDYYVPMAMHFYALLYMAADAADAVHAARYRERATQFAADFIHWFAADGAAIPFGRSLTYRCAQGAFVGALACAGVQALPWGVLKGVYLRHLRWWMRQPAFSETGLLGVGYAFPNTALAEGYNGPASSYWAMKVFAPLALPPAHPFWCADEAPLPARRSIHTVPGAGMVICSTTDTADVVALNAGQPVRAWPRHAAHKYSKFAYSTRFGFAVPVGLPSLEEGGFDNVLLLSDDEGQRYRARDHALRASVSGGVAYSTWQPWPDVTVETWLIAAPDAHVRVHHLHNRRALTAVDSGFACGYTRPDTLSGSVKRPGQAFVITPHGFSTLRDMTGTRAALIVKLEPGSHVLHPLAAMPALQARHAPGETWSACVVWGAAMPVEQPRWTIGQSSQGGFIVQRDQQPWCECRGATVLRPAGGTIPS